MSSTFSSTNIEHALAKTLQDLHVRAEVESVINDMVTDVELATSLEERLYHQTVLTQLERRLQQQESALEETRVIQQQHTEKQFTLADNLVKEFWALSHQLGHYKEMERQHQELLLQYDEVIAKLMQAEEDLQAYKEGRRQQQQDEEEREEQKIEEVANDSENMLRVVENQVTVGAEAGESTAENVTAVHSETVQISRSQEDDGDSKPAAEIRSDAAAMAGVVEPPVDTGNSAPTSPPAAAVVALDDDSVSETVPTLTELETEILMRIFAFLDALDILNTAQVNVSMYSRIDTLFGFGNEDNSTIATNETSTPPSSSTIVASQATAEPVPPPTKSVASTTSPTTTTKPTSATITSVKPAPSVTSTSSAAATTAATIAKIATKPISPSPESTSNAPPPPQAAAPRLTKSPAGLFGLLQIPGKQVSPIRRPTKDAHQPPMSAAMANSMAAKLTDSELNAILVMTEKLQRSEQIAAASQQEKEALQAKLDGVEAVKQFLIAKVRDMEINMQKAEEQQAQVALQVASDQEVIAFLDNKVQDLEIQLKRAAEEKKKLEENTKRMQEQAEQKSAVMGDMLQFEREKLRDVEREWKATKKLLIKEVKNCRAQIVVLQAERDGYREQNEMLRKAVLSPAGATLLSGDRTFS